MSTSFSFARPEAPASAPAFPADRADRLAFPSAMYAKILVGTDGSDTAAEAVRQAGELARLHGAELIVLHGAKTTSSGADGGMYAAPVDPDAIRSAAQEILQQAESSLGSESKVRTIFREGDPAEAVLDTAE